MLHVDPGAIARRLRRLIRADGRVGAVRDGAGHTWSCSVADDPSWPFVAAAAAHCGRVGCITRPSSLASVVSPATKLLRNFV